MYFKERETERLLLRKLSYLDAEALFSYRSKDELTLPQLKQWDSWVIKRQSVSSRRV